MALMALEEAPELINGHHSMNGLKDKKGHQCANGHNNINGHNGVNGIDGHNGIDGVKGIKGVNAVNGYNNPNGDKTLNGHGIVNGHDILSNQKGHSNGFEYVPAQVEQVKHEILSPPDNVEAAPPPIAIVGIGLRLPGKIASTHAFWDLLVNKKSTRCLVPKDRYNVNAFHSASGKPGTINSLYGHYLDCELDHMDASFFSMSKTEVESLDPQQRLLLEVIWECMESGGQKNWRGTNTGVYVGVYGDDWADLSAKDPQHLAMYRITSSTEFALANRVSYEFDLKGPSMTIRTGCSSSLVGLHEACQAIYSGACKSALVAGTSIQMSPTLAVTLAEQGVLSPTGSCKSFDAKADGYARGEAINAVYVKLLSDALVDGDPIRGVIRATGVNFDGKTPGITNPSAQSQEALIRKTYQMANIGNISDTAFVECHGTGTAVGDPLEVSAVGKAFGSSKDLWIGSVKPNVGHSEGASGLTSLIKGVLALEHEIIPPNINFSEPNPKIKWKEFGLNVPTEPVPWPSDRAARVSINNFGIGGANAHVIVDSARPYLKAALTDRDSEQHLLLFSANHPDSLHESIEKVSEYAESHKNRLADISFTLGARREHLPYRAYAIADGSWPLQISPIVKSSGAPPLNFVFTGQGAQWGGMGADLLTNFPSFQNDIKLMDKALRNLSHAPLWTIEKELLRPEKQTRLNQSEFSQPICAAVQIGLVNLLRSWNVHPAAVVGHSSGEIAAAYAAGALTFKAAIAVAYYRGQVTKLQLRAGGMAAVALGRSAVSSYLEQGIVIACENSPINVTLSGDSDKIDAAIQRIKRDKPGCFVRRLKVEQAYHSHHMQEISDLYESLLENLVLDVEPTVPFFSSITGKRISKAGLLGPSYWRTNMESPVLFSSAVQTMLQFTEKNSLFLEVGPHSALSGPLRDIFKSVDASSVLYMGTLVRNESGTQSMLSTLGQLYQDAVPVDMATQVSGRKVLTDLPTYAWHYDAGYWNESRVSHEWRFRKFPPHELLGIRILEADDLEPAWRNVLRLDGIPWVRDHKIKSDIVLPAAAYIAMAGEAIYQLSGIGATDFSLRQVDIRTALVLHELEHTEVITHLRPVRLTSSLDSVWWEFSIASYNGDTWVRHCNGQVRTGKGVAAVPENIPEHSRLVSSPAWYRTMKKIGLNYGPNFHGLKDISAAPGRKTAAASMTDRDQTNDSKYQLHPTTIDFCLQILITAIAEGSSRHLTKLCVPTCIDEIYVCQGTPKLRVEGTARTSANGSIHGTTTATADGQLALLLKGVRLSPLEDGEMLGDADTVAAAQLHWKPDIDFANPADLIRPLKGLRDAGLKLERLSLLCILETLNQVKDVKISGHLGKFQSWMVTQRERALAGKYDHVQDAEHLASLNGEALRAEMVAAMEEVRKSAGSDVGSVIMKAAANATAIYHGELEPIEVLIQDGGLQNVYDFIQAMTDCTPYFELLGHAKPTMKILEIGAGTGGTTVEVLRGVTSDSGERMYGQYDYTDISTGFFSTAQERFKNYDGIHFKTLDVTKDPIVQGFEPESYDLILASNVLHATPSIQETLQNVRKLLKPDGRLFLQELSPVFRMLNFIMGFLPGWWLGEADDRVDEPYVSPSRWDTELRQAGFSGTDAVIYDAEFPYQINANIIATTGTPAQPHGKVTILSEAQSGHAQALQHGLTQRGFSVSFSSLDSPPQAGVDVISLLDIEGSYFHEISSERLSKLQFYLGKLPSSSGLLWVTGHVQVGCKNPQYAANIGVARTIRSELSLDFATLEVDIDALDTEKVVAVFDKFRCRSKGLELDPDWEYAIVDNNVLVPRYRWIDTRRELQKIAGDGPRNLEPGRLGQLQSLRWLEKESVQLRDHEVEVEPRAVGMNFRDVMVAMGIIEGFRPDLGVECGGIVRKVGKTVQDVAVGDRVMLFHHGCFSTKFITPTSQLVKIPDSLSFEEAATMPCVYTTVIQALVNISEISKGQTVLIHSACGGIGIAAINICKMAGAEIFATVGNADKVKYLTDNYGIPSSHIFNSRNGLFYTDLMSATNGRGVDLVLNSLSGELLHLSWKCVARFGKMLEIGKRDLIGRAVLNMDLFEANRTFCGIDMSEIAVDRPQVFKKILNQCMDYYQKGEIKPITPIKTFWATQIHDAFRAMQQGNHIGKIVVNMPEDHEELPLTTMTQTTKFCADVSYLLVGGLGGLGRAISSWMVENGARHLIYLSRSGGDSARDQAFISELTSQGCSVQTFKGDVAKASDVANAVQNAAKPIAGVLHMSLVLKDRAILKFSHEDWHAAIKPKFDGARNLHEALESTKLDFFVSFSSVSYVVGQAGQANYAAANSYLAAFTQYRHSLNLPASVLNIGIVEDVGYVSENAAVLEQFKAMSYHTLQETDLLDALAFSISHQTSSPYSSGAYLNPADLTIGLRCTKPLSDPNNRIIWKRDMRMAMAHHEESKSVQASSSNKDLSQFLASVDDHPSMLDIQDNRDFLTRQIGASICSLMFRPTSELDVNLTLPALGVDSLVAIEICNWWRHTLGMSASVLEIMSAGSIASLGNLAAEGLKRLHAAPAVTG